MKKELLFSVTKKDLNVQTFRSGGAGGQHQNKRNSGVRIIHKESGARGESREERSQHQNKKIAFKRLVKNPKFKLWLNRKAIEVIDKKTIEQRVDEMMRNDAIKIEIQEDGKWIDYK
jgi:protein subunit release factor A